MINKSKISILVPNLHAGGAERVMANLANGLAAKGLSVDLVIVADKNSAVNKNNVPNLQIITLNKQRVLFSTWSLLKYLMKSKPNFILCSHNRINILVLGYKKLLSKKVHVVVRESNTFSVYYYFHKTLWDRVINFTAMKMYPICDFAVAVSDGVKKDLLENVNLPNDKVGTIYNPVIDSNIGEKASEPVEEEWLNQSEIPVIAGVGRIAPQKDFTTLIKAFAELLKVKEARLLLIGDRDNYKTEYEKLVDLIKTLNIEDKVKFTGQVDNPFAYLSKVSLFALSSRYEGLPGVLIQALACGCPSVATDCPSGPKEILEDGKYGELVTVGDHEALFKAMERSLNKKHDKELLIKRGHEFSVDKSVDNYLKLFYELSE